MNLAIPIGSEVFKRSYGVRLPYVAGSMYRGISSPAFVIAMARQRILSFFGSGGLSVTETRDALNSIGAELQSVRSPWGVNMMPRSRDAIDHANVILDSSATCIEVSGYVMCDLALAYIRAQTLKRPEAQRMRILGKVSRIETARMSSVPATSQHFARTREPPADIRW